MKVVDYFLKKSVKGLSWNDAWMHYTFYYLKCVLKCCFRLSFIDMTQLVIYGLLTLYTENREKYKDADDDEKPSTRFATFCRNFWLKHNPSYLWPVHWIYESDFENWGEELPKEKIWIYDNAKRKREKLDKHFNILMLGCPYTKEQQEWMDRHNDKQCARYAEIKKLKKEGKLKPEVIKCH